MKTVKQACQLAPNALSIDVSDQIEQLDALINTEGNGQSFYDKTFITAGMRDLLRGTIERLAGKSSNAIFHLKQAMGGGKTHLIVGTGLVAKDATLRKRVCADIEHASAFESARVVAFNGRNSPEHYFWGEIAKQLGLGEQFKKFWDNGPDAPDETHWLALLKSDLPTLILLDEMPPYFQYLGTRQTGTGTVADIATRAFANMLSAAGKLSNVCIVVSDLDASYAEGGKLIERALQDARKELGRQEKTIVPVDLAGNEIYDILRKRLFVSLPDQAEIQNLAAKYGQALEDATKSKVIARGAEALADEIEKTYPFHPRLKDLVALFKENEQFKQTRGLMELMSRLLKSVWERDSDDVYLIGAQHFNMTLPDVRSKLADISNMQDVISKDVWDVNFSAHAQQIDAGAGNNAASETASILLVASLSNAVNAVKGLTAEEILECVVSPLHTVTEYTAAFESLKSMCWFLHHNQDNKFYFDRQENLTKMLQGLANDAPIVQIENLIKQRLETMFAPERKAAYAKVIAQPKLTDVAEEVKRHRVLLIIDPDSKLPPEELGKFFQSLTEKNNLLVLTGEKTQMLSIQKAARKVYAAGKADSRISKNHVQREEYEQKAEQAQQDLNATLLSVFDSVIYPVQLGAKAPELKSKPLDNTRDTTKPFKGEDQIEKTLTSQPKKLHLDIEADFDSLRDLAEGVLWNDSADHIDWSTVVSRAKQRPKMAWLPSNGLDTLKNIALQRGVWEELGSGNITHTPPKKKTSVQVTTDTSVPDDSGNMRLRVNPINAGPSARIHYAEDGVVSATSPTLNDETFTTKAYRVQFLAVDPHGKFETGESVNWETRLKIRAEQVGGSPRSVELRVAPGGSLKYTLDGSEARNGTSYTGPIEIGEKAVTLLVFAEGGGLETKEKFTYADITGDTDARTTTIVIDDKKPAVLNGRRNLGSRQDAYKAIEYFKNRSVKAEQIQLVVGQARQAMQFGAADVAMTGDALEAFLSQMSLAVGADSPVNLGISKLLFGSGADLKDFTKEFGFPLNQHDIQQ